MEEQRSATARPKRGRIHPEAPGSRAPRPRSSWRRLLAWHRNPLHLFWALLTLAVLVVVAVVAAVVVTIITIAIVPWRIPSALAAHWPVYLLVLSSVLMALGKFFCGGQRRDGDAARPHLAPDWLCRRLLALNKPTATVIIASDRCSWSARTAPAPAAPPPTPRSRAPLPACYSSRITAPAVRWRT
jgi:hypothetical protein